MKFIKENKTVRPLSPARTITIGFFAIILVGTFLLSLPIASKSGESLSILSSMFTATSCTCVTGLTVIDPFNQFTMFGQAVMLLLIEIGGIGIGTITTFFMMVMGRRLGLRSLKLAQESTSSWTFADVKGLLKTVMAISLIIQTVGAAILAITFVPKYGTYGIWVSVFLSVSSFCNAGFDVLGMEGAYSSLINYNGELLVMLPIMALIILGGLGFIVYYDLLHYRKTKRLTLQTKLVLAISGVLVLLGFVLFFALEYTNPKTLGEMNTFEKIIASLFQSVTARTAGYASVDINGMRASTKIMMIALMFIGGSTSSTAGGIKVTTIAIVGVAVINFILGKDDVLILKKRIPRQTVNKSMAIFFLGLAIVGVLCCILMATTDGVSGIDVVFEAFSAFGTAGLTAGVTEKMTAFGKIATMFTMFIGRVGPSAFALAISIRGNRDAKRVYPEAKILVG